MRFLLLFFFLQWFSKIANLQDGKPPPAGSPGWMMNIGGGNKYALGDYNRANESWTTDPHQVSCSPGVV